MKISGLAFAALVLSSIGGAASAEVACPAKMGGADYITKVSKAVEAAKTCDAAVALANSCAMGSSGDSAITAPAYKKCEAAAKPALANAKVKARLDAAFAACNKENNQQGSMYVGMNAFCHLEAMQKAAHTAAAPPAPKCPATIGSADYLDKVTKAVAAQKTCATAVALADACAMGSSGDGAIVTPAMKTCEAAAKKNLSDPKNSAALKAAYAKCDKQNHHEGSMYVGMNAFCHLEALAAHAK
jgi:hypothetical protein